MGYIKTKFLRVTEYHKQIFLIKKKRVSILIYMWRALTNRAGIWHLCPPPPAHLRSALPQRAMAVSPRLSQVPLPSPSGTIIPQETAIPLALFCFLFQSTSHYPICQRLASFSAHLSHMHEQKDFAFLIYHCIPICQMNDCADTFIHSAETPWLPSMPGSVLGACGAPMNEDTASVKSLF